MPSPLSAALLRATAAAALAVAALAASAQPASLDGLRLVDHRKQPLAARSFAGHPTLVHFVFTGCSATCPTQVRELADVHGALPDDVRRRVRFLSVSVDAANDTPATLAAFARSLDAERDGWHFATGDFSQVERLAERLQAIDRRAAKPGPQDHRTSLYLYDAAGTLLQRYGGVPVDRARLVDELTRVARAAPRR